MNKQAKAQRRRLLMRKLVLILAYGLVLIWMLSQVFAEERPKERHGSSPAPISSEFQR